MPEYTYAGVTYPSAIADVFPQASLSEDFESDGYPEVIVPLNKAYGTPVYAALPIFSCRIQTECFCIETT